MPNLIPSNWQFELSEEELQNFLQHFDQIIPKPDYIFNAFRFVNPETVKCIILGEDPYPRSSSAYGVSFWDKEITDWSLKSRGNSLKHIHKSLLIHLAKADYSTSLEDCREISKKIDFPSPDELFQSWMRQGVLLMNTALTFSSAKDKKMHFKFWKPILKQVLQNLNDKNKPFFILWGKKAQTWANEITDLDESRIIRNGHPTYQHQFLRKENPTFSPFTEIIEKTGIDFV